MADPKYANLPGIVHDQPDLYETSDLPEDEQTQGSGDESENVEILELNVNQAFDRFKGTSLDSAKIDFSDRVSRGRRTGYDVRTEYEIAESGSDKETPQQKFQRLQCEIRELADEVSQIKEQVKEDSSSEKLSPVVVAKQTEYLQQQLSDLHLDQLLGEPSSLQLSDPQGALHKRLLTELDAFKAKGERGTKQKPAPPITGADPDHVTYQLHYRPEQAKFSDNAKVADLEQRLERLEALLGNNPEKLSSLTAESGNKSLLGAVALLTAKTKLLEPAQLDQIEGRLVSLNQKLSQISDQKVSVQDADKNNKISELYELVKKWDAMSDTLPHVVDRLTALQGLHQQAVQFSQTLTHLDTAQQQISTQLKGHGDMLKQVDASVGENIAMIKSNCESLDTRIQALK